MTNGSAPTPRRASDSRQVADGWPAGAIELVEVGMALVDSDGVVLRANDSLLAFLRRPATDVVGHPFTALTRHPAATTLDPDGLPLVAAFARPDGGSAFARLTVSAVPGGRLVQVKDLAERQAWDREMRARAERAAAMVALSDDLAVATGDPQRLLEVATAALARIAGDGAAIWLPGAEPGTVEAASVVHPEARSRDFLRRLGGSGRLAGPHDGLIHTVMRQGRSLVVGPGHDVSPDTYAEARPWLERYGMSSLLLCPLRASDAVLGALGMTRDAGSDPFTDEDRALAETLAARVALAIQNGRLVARLESELTERRRVESVLRSSEERLRALVENASDVILVVDRHGSMRYASPALERMTGRPAASHVGESALSFVHPDDRLAVRSTFAGLVAGERVGQPVEFRVTSGQREVRHAEAVAVDRLDDPAVGGIVVTVRDVTRRHRDAARLTEYGESQAAVAALGQRALVGTRLDDVMEEAARLVVRQLGVSHASVMQLLPGGQSFRMAAGSGWPPGVVGSRWLDREDMGMAWWVVTRNEPAVSPDMTREVRWAQVRPMVDAGVVSSAAVVIPGRPTPYGVLGAHVDRPRTWSPDDVGFLQLVANVLAAAVERWRDEDMIRQQATHDPLTGLPNRVLLTDRLDQALAAARRHGTRVGLLLLDLDGFKSVNDVYGHSVGDRLLGRLTARLRASLRASDTLARIGGDEFAFLVPEVASVEDAEAVARKALDVVREPHDLDGIEVTVSGSIGVAVCPDHTSDPGELLERADAAMYRAKRRGSGVAVWRADADLPRSGRLVSVGELRRAIEEGQLVLHYQPIVDLVTGEVRQLEALVRWQHPLRGLLPPAEFVPLAEQSGLIRPLSALVVEEALSATRRFAAAGHDLTVAVNVSSTALDDPGLVERLAEVVAAEADRPGRIAVEITESALVHEGMRAVVDRLAAAGLGLAIDDFGTGYSSLAYLKQLPVTQLKIDRSFVTRMDADPRDVLIVRSVVQLAHTLGILAVAEGVETEHVRDVLRDQHVDLAQGFLFSPALPPDELLTWLATER